MSVTAYLPNIYNNISSNKGGSSLKSTEIDRLGTPERPELYTDNSGMTK